MASDAIFPDAILTDLMTEPIQRGDCVVRASDPARPGTVECFVHQWSRDGYAVFVSVTWDDGTETHEDRSALLRFDRTVEREPA